MVIFYLLSFTGAVIIIGYLYYYQYCDLFPFDMNNEKIIIPTCLLGVGLLNTHTVVLAPASHKYDGIDVSIQMVFVQG